MKKRLAGLLTGSLLLFYIGFAGCGSSDTKPTQATPTPTTALGHDTALVGSWGKDTFVQYEMGANGSYSILGLSQYKWEGENGSGNFWDTTIVPIAKVPFTYTILRTASPKQVIWSVPASGILDTLDFIIP